MYNPKHFMLSVLFFVKRAADRRPGTFAQHHDYQVFDIVPENIIKKKGGMAILIRGHTCASMQIFFNNIRKGGGERKTKIGVEGWIAFWFLSFFLFFFGKMQRAARHQPK